MTMPNVFERLRSGEHIDIRDHQYQKEVHGEIDRCDHLCYAINHTDTLEKDQLQSLENELFTDKGEGSYFTPPLYVDCANRMLIGKNVYGNHGLNVMSVGTVIIEDGVMMGPQVSLLTVNHEPNNIRTIYTGEIHIKKNAWIGANVSILPGVTIGESAIVGTGSIVTHDVPDHSIAVGNPARVIRKINKE